MAAEGAMSEPDVERRAEEAFVRFLMASGAQATADSAAVERLCAEHADLAPALRGLFADWRRVTALMGQSLGAGPGPLAPEDDPRVTLGDGGELERGLFARLGRPEGSSGPAARYEVRGEVARGGMGVILHVWDPNLRRSLAMKVLRGAEGASSSASAGHRPRSLARFLEEAQINGQLEHPGILPVHDLGLDPQGRVYFTMPLVRGRDLKQVIELARRGAEGWSQVKVLRALVRVCEAVAYAHSRGVIHRDLKPANVMVGRFGEVYVMDWGLARVVGRPDGHDLRIAEDGVATERGEVRATAPDSPLLTADGTVIGTPAYVSPEQLGGARDELDGRTDVYSLGAMLYELITGRMPFCALGEFTPPRQVLAARVDGPPTPVAALAPATPSDLIAVCEKAMALRPGERYATPLEMAEDLERYLTDRPVRAQEASLAHDVKLAYRRNRLVVNLSAAAVLLLGLVLFRGYSVRRAAEQRRYDALAVGALVAREAELRPILPGRAPAMQAWVGEVADLLSREPQWRRERDGAAGEVRAEAEGVLAAMAELRELRAGVERGLAQAVAIHDSTFAQAWDEAVRAIAVHPLYDRLEMPRLDTCLPLGPDPQTSLWEFWNFPSGARPVRGPDGSIVPRSGDGLVLVLVPGRHRCGIDMDPFLAGKYEVTQAQWLRIMRENPSLYRAGLVIPGTQSTLHPDYMTTDLHPVEHASWSDAMEFAERTGTGLLTETQWFYACRAWTSTRWLWGDSPDAIAGMANLADASASNFHPEAADWDDGYTLHSPVGSYPANPFGLYDVDGNVSEWCADIEVAGDWIGSGVRRQYCGAAFMDTVWQATVGRFGIDKPEFRAARPGVRVGLSLPGMPEPIRAPP
jgi:serine/threonine protein kinase